MPRHRPSMLVVDDDPAAGELLHETFERDGYDVILLKRGTDAIQLAEEHRFDIVLSDVRLPDIDGLEVLRRLKKRFV